MRNSQFGCRTRIVYITTYICVSHVSHIQASTLGPGDNDRQRQDQVEDSSPGGSDGTPEGRDGARKGRDGAPKRLPR